MPAEAEAVLSFREVSKDFKVRGRMLHAVDRVSFDVPKGRTVGLVGESGSGKSTVGRLGLGLLPITEGTAVFKGHDLRKLSAKEIRPLRRSMQLIFQDPQASLSQRMTVGAAIHDALSIHNIGTPKERWKRVDELMERVGLTSAMTQAYPFELSGGQLQRVGIARALSVGPELVVCDEPVSALDVSIQIQIIHLLRELQAEMNLSYIFISHNLAVVEYLSDEVVVLYLGQVVEQAPAEQLFSRPSHPYTRVLIDSILKVPKPDEPQQKLEALRGEMPSPFNPPSGCTFHGRCPIAQDICRTEIPQLRPLEDGHTVKCHFAE